MHSAHPAIRTIGISIAANILLAAISAVIAYNSYRIFRPAFGEIMDEHLYQDLEVQVRALSLQIHDVLGTEKCYIRKTGMHYHVDLHVIVDASITIAQGHAIAHRVKDHLMRQLPELAGVHIHVEPGK